MVKARIAAVVGAAILALASAAQASVVPPTGPSPAPAHAPNAEFDSPAVDTVLLTAAFASPDSNTTQILPTNTQAVAGRMSSTSVGASAPASEFPFYSYLLSAGEIVLELGAGPKQQAVPQVSAVPLPGAIWLFGSALVAFLCIAGRRRL